MCERSIDPLERRSLFLFNPPPGIMLAQLEHDARRFLPGAAYPTGVCLDETRQCLNHLPRFSGIRKREMTWHLNSAVTKK